jgi:2,4'-dihydroxyacetophenone dioxygenase
MLSVDLGLPIGHVSEEDAPWVQAGDVGLRVVMVDIPKGLWVIANRFPAGYTVIPHQHTGSIHAWTAAGSWRYLEYDVAYTAGSYVFEPAGSKHTLKVDDHNTGLTEVFFVIEGANLNLDGAGNVISITDAASINKAYRALCAAQGLTPRHVER